LLFEERHLLAMQRDKGAVLKLDQSRLGDGL
jgi:hypothetical protein